MKPPFFKFLRRSDQNPFQQYRPHMDDDSKDELQSVNLFFVFISVWYDE